VIFKVGFWRDARLISEDVLSILLPAVSPFLPLLTGLLERNVYIFSSYLSRCCVLLTLAFVPWPRSLSIYLVVVVPHCMLQTLPMRFLISPDFTRSTVVPLYLLGSPCADESSVNLPMASPTALEWTFRDRPMPGGPPYRFPLLELLFAEDLESCTFFNRVRDVLLT